MDLFKTLMGATPGAVPRTIRFSVTQEFLEKFALENNIVATKNRDIVETVADKCGCTVVGGYYDGNPKNRVELVF